MTKTQKTFGIDFKTLQTSGKTEKAVCDAFITLCGEISKMQEEIKSLKAQLNQ